MPPQNQWGTSTGSSVLANTETEYLMWPLHSGELLSYSVLSRFQCGRNTLNKIVIYKRVQLVS